jgi:hypothetical protein
VAKLSTTYWVQTRLETPGRSSGPSHSVASR